MDNRKVLRSNPTQCYDEKKHNREQNYVPTDNKSALERLVLQKDQSSNLRFRSKLKDVTKMMQCVKEQESALEKKSQK